MGKDLTAIEIKFIRAVYSINAKKDNNYKTHSAKDIH